MVSLQQSALADAARNKYENETQADAAGEVKEDEQEIKRYTAHLALYGRKQPFRGMRDGE